LRNGLVDSPLVQALINLAIQEDVGRGDITTNSVVDAATACRANIVAKEPGVLAGFPVMEMVFGSIHSGIELQPAKTEGAEIAAGDIVGRIYGPARSILTGERIALNFLQRMSGIATYTRRLSCMIEAYKARIVDTRKTTPGWRVLEKYAVRTGGGCNHRLGLDDAVMIKDNHIAAAGGITAAVERARAAIPFTARVEVETEDRDQVEEALAAGADIIMLDNMTPAQVAEMVELVDGQAITEASGTITEANLVEMAATGVDYISIGTLTHSVRSLDIGIDLVP